MKYYLLKVMESSPEMFCMLGVPSLFHRRQWNICSSVGCQWQRK